ncbi:Photosystem I reaction center subunit V, chloroplastic [Olea europaea subsp. europaea]|uniref:Photosystem I reaction center subunit V, chloroplastic n=1 Tax=Olea europaea subsp. europaea TaxID=158383 RepID=A0A8S0Q3M1_OLEEU|nr:Photosystem I reaction center subunit V, chloroplastic [Olea europaea subsp. europaea]
MTFGALYLAIDNGGSPRIQQYWRLDSKMKTSESKMLENGVLPVQNQSDIQKKMLGQEYSNIGKHTEILIVIGGEDVGERRLEGRFVGELESRGNEACEQSLYSKHYSKEDPTFPPVPLVRYDTHYDDII